MRLRAVMRCSGFTLLELLVVVAILGVLAALLFPLVTKSINNAQNVGCVSNLRQISGGLMAYAADHDGQLPPGASISDPAMGSGSWANVLEPYMGVSDLPWTSVNRPAWQRCPAQTFPTMTAWTIGYGWNYASWIIGSKTYGGFGYSNFDDPYYARENMHAFSRMVQVTAPAQTIIIGDSTDSMDPTNDYQHRYLYPPILAQKAKFAQRHNGHGNYLFLDGHIEGLSQDQVIANPNIFARNK